MLRKFALTLVIVVAALAQGCTSLSDVRGSQGGGTERTYNVEFDRAWEAVIAGVRTSGLSVAGENKARGYVLAQRGVTGFSWGENVAIFVKRISARQTSIEIVSKGTLATNITAPDWTGELFNLIEQRIGNRIP